MSNVNKPTGSNQGKKPVVRVQRRRPPGAAGSAERERAEAPHREGREDQGVSAPPSSRLSSSQSGIPY